MADPGTPGPSGPSRAGAPATEAIPIRPWSLIASLATVAAAPAFFVADWPGIGFALLFLGLLLSLVANRREGPAVQEPFDPRKKRAPIRVLSADLLLIALALVVVQAINLEAKLDDLSMLRFTVALSFAVIIPYALSRWLYRQRAISFPWRGGGRWGWFHWGWLVGALLLAYLILPWYFMTSGVYENWPEVQDANTITRLFIGVGAVGIWDELFFICTVFALLRRHFPWWFANLLQTIVFVSFLWELGYRSWGPALTIPFALVQGLIFMRTRSLAYVVTVHLLFDAVVFMVLVHAHNPELFDIFITAPW